MLPNSPRFKRASRSCYYRFFYGTGDLADFLFLVYSSAKTLIFALPKLSQSSPKSSPKAPPNLSQNSPNTLPQLSHNSHTTLPQLSHNSSQRLMRARSARTCHVFTDSPTHLPASPRISQTSPDSPIFSLIPPESPRLYHTLPHAPRLFRLRRASRSCYYR